jgi:peptidoglycan/LPS O-acetylase OafA/YrhL
MLNNKNSRATTNLLHTRTSGKFEELEGVRGLAATLIVIFHIETLNKSEMFYYVFISNCYLMVPVFFVLSGFVIHNAYSKKICTFKNLFDFQFLRFARLYPIHVIFLLVFLSYEFSKYIAENKFGFKFATTSFHDKNYFEAFVLNLFLIQSLWEHYDGYPSFNTPSWSISVEFYTYLLFGLIILKLNSVKNYIFLFLITISIYLLINKNFNFVFSNLLSCFSGFFIGCLTSEILPKIKILINKYVSTLVLIFILVFLSLKISPILDSLIYFFTSILIVTLILCPNGILNKLLRTRFFIWLGAISYSIYMCHFIVLKFAEVIIRKVLVFPQKLDNGIYFPQLSTSEALIFLSLIVIIVLLISSILYYFIEAPIRRKSRELIFKPTALM